MIELTYLTVVSAITYILAELLKVAKIKYVAWMNVVVGIIASVVCMVAGVLPYSTASETVSAVLTCVIASLGAGGFYDILKIKTKEMLGDDPKITNHEV